MEPVPLLSKPEVRYDGGLKQAQGEGPVTQRNKRRVPDGWILTQR